MGKSDKVMHRVGANVKRLRAEMGLSQKAFAKRAGVGSGSIERIENGGNASVETLEVIAQCFNVDVVELFLDWSE